MFGLPKLLKRILFLKLDRQIVIDYRTSSHICEFSVLPMYYNY